MQTVRLAICAALLSLGGCVAYPVPVATPYPAYQQAVPQSDTTSYVGSTCAAGFYVCPVTPGPLGAPCSCPGLGAPSYGTIR